MSTRGWTRFIRDIYSCRAYLEAGFRFTPLQCVKYRADYVVIARELNRLAKANDPAFLESIRHLCTSDLFFLLYFVLGVVEVNHPWLIERVYEVADRNDRTVDLWAREHFKAVDVNEPVLTPHGWRKHGDLFPGDQVYGGDGFPVNVIAKTEVFTNADCYRVEFDDGYSVVVSGDHLWSVEQRTRKRDYYKRQYRETTVLNTRDILKHGFSADNRLATWISPVEFPYRELPIHPYVMGVWLGDGTSSCGRITSGDCEIFDYISLLGYFVKDTSVNITKKILTIPQLRGSGVFQNKHIPEEYLFSSLDQRWELLRGLMDTDGTVNDRGTATFTNINESLIDDFCILARSVGLKVHKNKYFQTVNGEAYPFFFASFQAYKQDRPFHLKRKLERCKDGYTRRRRFITNVVPVDSIPVSCIQVDNDGTYLIGKHLAVTHNSTIINFALTIQDILKNPEERIGIFSHKRHIAQAFLRRIRHSLTTNKLLKAAFPNVLYVKPESQAEKWSDEGFIVKRSGSYDECTVEAWGLVDNLPTSKHYTIRIYDDIVTDESVNTVEMMEKTLHAFRQSHNLQQRGGKVRVIGTIYDYGDVNHLLSQDKMWHVRIHSARDKNGKPVYLTERELEQRLHDNGQWNFDCQYMLNPIERSKRKFDVAWLKYHEGKTSGGNRYIVVDPGKTKKKTSDYTVMWVIEVDGRGNRIVLDGVRDKLTLRETWDALAALIERWNNVIRVGYARAGFERDKEYLHEKQQETGIFFAIQDIQERGDKIRSRISSLQPLFEAGKIIFPKALIYTDVDGNEHNLTEEFIKEEYTRFPSCSHDDMLDCLSMILSEEMKVSKSYREEPVMRVPYSIFDDTHYDPHAWMNL